MAAIEAIALPGAPTALPFPEPAPRAVEVPDAKPVATPVAAPVAAPLAGAWAPAGGADLYRTIYLRSGVASPGVCAITSTCRHEGRTTIALGLATTIARDFPDHRVALIELDFEQPALAQKLGLKGGPGALECIAAGKLLTAARQHTPLRNLDVVVSGGAAAPATADSSDTTDNAGTADAGQTPVRWLSAKHVPTLVKALRSSYDVVLLDAPAIVANAGMQTLVPLTDGVLFVVRADATPASLVSEAVALIEPTKLRGVVLNRAQTRVPGWVRRLAGL